MNMEPGLYGLLLDMIENFDPSALGHPTTSSRASIATEDDALVGSIELARAIEGLRERGVLGDEDARHLGALLLVIRDYVLPLPEQRFLDAEPQIDRTPHFLELALEIVRRARD